MTSEAWTLAALTTETSLVSATNEEITALIDELFDEWVPEGGVEIDSLNTWACQRLNTSLDTVTPKILEEQTQRRIAELLQTRQVPQKCSRSTLRYELSVNI